MPSTEAPSAETIRLGLVREQPKCEVHYYWSLNDRAMCEKMFTAARRAGVVISSDCVHAVSRSDDPANEVQLDRVLLAEFGSDNFLSDPKRCGIAAFAAGLLQESISPALSIAGAQLTAKVQLAESAVTAIRGSRSEDLSGQDDNYVNVH